MGICCMAQETQTRALYQSRGVDGVGDGREVQKRGDICIPMADSCWGLTNKKKNSVKQLSFNKKLIKKNKFSVQDS